MANATQFQTGGVVYNVKDASASELVADARSVLGNVVKYNLVDPLDAEYHAYYENVSGQLQIHYSQNASTYIVKNPIRLLAGKKYSRGYLYNAFTFVCAKGTLNIITSISGQPDPYIPANDCDLYVTIDNGNLNSAFLYNTFTGAEFNTDKTLAVANMPADAKAVGEGFVDIDRTYYVRDVAVSTADTTDRKTDIALDITRPMYVTIKNTSTSSGYFRAGIYVGDVWRYAGEQVLINGGESYTWKLQSMQSNSTISHTYFADNSFSGYTVTLSTKNTNQRTATVTVYSFKKDEPLKEGNIIYVTATPTDGAFNDLLGAFNYAKYKFDVTSVHVTIFLKPGVHVIQNCSSRLAVINKGANKISLIGENPYTTFIKLVNDGANNNQMIDHGGDSVIQGITFLNLHTGADLSFSNNPYCIHNDRFYDVDYKYTTAVKDCVLYCELASPVGAGLHDNQKQVYENVTCVFNNGSSVITEGAMYVHSQANASATPVGLEIIGCRLISQNGMRCLSLPSVTAGDYLNIPVTIRDCFGWTNGTVSHYATLAENTKLTPDSNVDGSFVTQATFDYPITK